MPRTIRALVVAAALAACAALPATSAAARPAVDLVSCPLNCLGGDSTGTGKVTWSNPGTTPSRFTFTGGISLRPDGVTVLVLTGHVTSGDYQGSTLINAIVLASTDLTACLTPQGLTTISGTISLTTV
ncbi:hypothetical protein [Streptomyces sp. NPDC018610]|uniref:hypothetical protein n=1 Tax=Streptomyces sp. NPDC018610 TaxID=3365049 RepID=UPI0037A76A93